MNERFAHGGPWGSVLMSYTFAGIVDTLWSALRNCARKLECLSETPVPQWLSVAPGH